MTAPDDASKSDDCTRLATPSGHHSEAAGQPRAKMRLLVDRFMQFLRLRRKTIIAFSCLCCGLGSTLLLGWTHVRMATSEASAQWRLRMQAKIPTYEASDKDRLLVQSDAGLKYLLYLPRDYNRKASWPLLLFLHGHEERGDDLGLVMIYGPPKLIDDGKEFPFIVVSPQSPGSHGWDPTQLVTLIDKLIDKYKVDKSRIYVTGLSMGGAGTWSLAAYAPQRIAAIVPIANAGDPSTASHVAHVAVWAFFGDNDRGLKTVQQTVDALKARGNDAKLTVYPYTGHDAWTATYNDPQVYDWLLSQHQRFTPAGHR